MTIPKKTLKNGFSIPIFGLGTWGMGGLRHRDEQNDDSADVEAIKTAIKAGITHIDTAESYADGHSEILINQAISDFDRSTLFMVSKVSPYNQGFSQLKKSLKGSLSRMGLDYLHLYLLHQPSEDFSIEETMRAMDELKDEGLIRNIGVSNFTVNQMKKAQKATKHTIVVNQVHYNLMVREVEDKGILKYCQQNDVILMSWRPLQMGEILTLGDSILKKMAQKYKKTPAQIALNWLTSQKNVVVISKMRNPDHLEENLNSVGWEMEEEDIDYLRKEFPKQVKVSEVIPLKEW